MPMRVEGVTIPTVGVAYCRVSTKNQEAALIDHQEQWKEIFAREGITFANSGVFYKKNGYKEYKKGLYVDEGISAKEYKKHRKAFQQMIADAISGKFKLIWVEDTTRFARSIEDGMKVIKDLREHGVNVHFRKENLDSIDPNNDMFLSFFFTIAENEIRIDSNRLKWKQERLHKAGKWTAPAPYGYDVNKGELSINAKETPIVDLIFYLYTKNMLGMRVIANTLNHRGLRTRKNQLWKHSEIKYILDNRIYIGDIVNHKTESVDITRGTTRKIPEDEQIVIHNEKLRIIDDETWNKKNIIMQQRNEKLKDRQGHSSKHLLSTLLYCQQCGSTLIRVKRKNAKNETGKKVDRGYEWTCLGHLHYGDMKCKGRYSIAEDEFIEYVKKELKKEKEKEQKKEIDFLDIYTEKKREERDSIDIEKIKEEKENINKVMFELRIEKTKKLISDETFEEQIKELNNKLSELRKIENQYNNLCIDIERAEMRYEDQMELLENLDFENLTNADLKTIFNKIKIMAEYENGYKNIYVHFSYNVIDETKTELLRDEMIEIGESSITEWFLPYKAEKIRKSTHTRYFEKLE